MNSTVKTAATEPLITDAFLNFRQTIKSPKTKSNYIQALKYYMKFSRIENYDDLLRHSSTPDGLLGIQKNIILFIEYCKQRKPELVEFEVFEVPVESRPSLR